jgi:peptidoglycan/xylan/chitin deacetylase (PgdA/CDA1 family)
MHASPGSHAPIARRRRRLVVAPFALLLATSAALIAAGAVPSAGAASRAAAVASPTPQASPRAFVKHPQPVPILVYHHVQPYKAGYYLIYVGTAQFASQLSYLHHNGYHPVTLRRVYDAWTGRAKLPRRPVVLSFDDGYLDQYTSAAHLLHRYHYPAVLDLVVHNGTALSRAMIRQMIAWGWEVDSHTLTHPLLTHLTASQLRYQLVASRRIIRRRFHAPVDFLCYPGGVYDRRVMRAVRAAGYLGATTIHYGRAIPRGRFAMPRIAVYWGESLGTFGSRMRTAPRMGAAQASGDAVEVLLRRATTPAP